MFVSIMKSKQDCTSFSQLLNLIYQNQKTGRMKLKIMLMLLLLPAASAIEINEIMYNPEGADSGNEWVEIFSNNFTDFTNWTIGDLASNDTIFPLFVTGSSYSIIMTQNLSINHSNYSVYYCGATIGNGLANSGDSVFLYYNSTLVDNITYTDEFANGNNKTVERFNDSWHESLILGGTPGKNNSVSVFLSNTTNYTNSTNITILNETGIESNNTNQSNTTENNSSEAICAASILISTTKDVFFEESIKFKHIINSSEDFYITYWIEDLFGNIVKKEYETTTLTEKSFTPKPKENDRVYIIKSILHGCEEEYSEKLVIFRKENEIFEKEEDEESESKEYTDEDTKEEEQKKKFSYSIISHTANITQGSYGSVIVELNSDDEDHLIRISAYLYRGPKKYSEVSEKSLTLEKLSSETIELKFFTDAGPGDYKLKVKINKDNQKTDYELRENVTMVKGKEDEIDEEETETEDKESKKETNEKKPRLINITNPSIVYKSPKAKSEALIPIIMISMLAVLSGVLIWKR